MSTDNTEPQQSNSAITTAQYLVQNARSNIRTQATSMPPPPAPVRYTENKDPKQRNQEEGSSEPEDEVPRLSAFPYTCYCGGKFSTEQNYSEHTEHQKCIKWDSILFKDDRVICACGEEFTEPLSLDIHLKLRECVNLFPETTHD